MSISGGNFGGSVVVLVEAERWQDGLPRGLPSSTPNLGVTEIGLARTEGPQQVALSDAAGALVEAYLRSTQGEVDSPV